MGDPSVFINLMLRYPGNRQLAKGLVDYLTADDSWGQRQGRLLIISNRFSQSGAFGGGEGLRGSLAGLGRDLAQWLADMRENGLPALLALALGALCVMAAAAWAALRATRLHLKRAPTYARSIPAVAQGGNFGRAAVLAAPTTHRALVVLELKAALEEALVQRLNLPKGSSHDRILESVAEQEALSPSLQHVLKHSLSNMRRAETAVMSSEPVRFSVKQLGELNRQVKEIVASLRQEPTWSRSPPVPHERAEQPAKAHPKSPLGGA